MFHPDFVTCSDDFGDFALVIFLFVEVQVSYAYVVLVLIKFEYHSRKKINWLKPAIVTSKIAIVKWGDCFHELMPKTGLQS